MLAGGALLTGLADPLVERQVQGALVKAGVNERRAACMAGPNGRPPDKSPSCGSSGRAWQRCGASRDEGYGLGELVKRLDRVGDGEAVAVLATSAGAVRGRDRLTRPPLFCNPRVPGPQCAAAEEGESQNMIRTIVAAALIASTNRRHRAG